jgi:hypothetical protein
MVHGPFAHLGTFILGLQYATNMKLFTHAVDTHIMTSVAATFNIPKYFAWKGVYSLVLYISTLPDLGNVEPTQAMIFKKNEDILRACYQMTYASGLHYL